MMPFSNWFDFVYSRSPRCRSRNNRWRSNSAIVAGIEWLEDRTLLSGPSDRPVAALTEHIHAELAIVVNDQGVPIPTDLGVESDGIVAFVHTHDDSGELHIHPLAQPPAQSLTLGDFFETWRTNAGLAGNNPDAIFNQTQILDNTVDASHVIRVFVNSCPITEFENYVIRDEDQIVISYESLANSNSPTLLPIEDVTLLSGSPLHIPLDGFDPNGQSLSFTASSDNPAVTTFIPQGNRSLRFNVRDFGVMEFQLFDGRAFRPANRIALLAESGFYDGIIFHRVIDEFVIQAGDPTGTGSGGSTLGDFDDQFHVDLQHNRTGLLSMAKTTDDTNDSQFFITEGPSRPLDFHHSIFGLLTQGENVRELISKVEVDAGDRPTTDVVIDQAEVFSDNENGVLMLAANAGVSGEADITVTVTDEDGNSFQRTFHVIVQVDTSDGNPFLQDIPEFRSTAGVPVAFQLEAIDVEGDPFTFSGFLVPDANDQINYTAALNNGLVTVTPFLGFVGTVQVLVRVSSVVPANTVDLFDTQLVTIHVDPTVLPNIEITATDSDAAETGTDPGSLTITRTNTEVAVFRDDFNGTALDSSLWSLPDAGDSSFLGRTKLRVDQAPQVVGGVARLQFDTHNPTATVPGDSFFGSEIRTTTPFNRQNGLIFVARTRLVNDQNAPLPRGLVASLFSFGLNGNIRDEIDFELLTNDIVDANERILTNVFDDDDFNQPGDFEFANIAGIDLTAFNTYRVEWLPDRVRWFVNDLLVREGSSTLPDDAMDVRLNFWAPDAAFAVAFDNSLQPASNANDNQTFFYEVDFVEIRRVLDEDLPVDFSVTGSATNGIDYQAISDSIVIASGSSSTSITISPLDDVFAEGNETVTLSLTPHETNYTIGSNANAIVTIADDDPLPTMVNVDTILVLQPTAVDANGEVDVLPANAEWIDEWNEFDIEFWVTVLNAEHFGVAVSATDLLFNSQFFTATQVDFGPGFSANQTFNINNATGQVSNISASTTNGEVGDGRAALFARVHFESSSANTIPLNTNGQHVQPVTDLGFGIANVSVSATNIDTITVVAGPIPNPVLRPVVYDLNDDGAVDFSDFSVFAGVFRDSVGIGSPNDAYAADFNFDNQIDFGDFSLLAANFRQTRESGGTRVYSNDFPTGGNALRAQSLPSSNFDDTLPSLTDAQLQPIAAEAVSRINNALGDPTAADLQTITFEISDLPNGLLAQTRSNVIVIDADAVGIGWFIDATPATDLEFATAANSSELTATPSGPAAHRVDLLTVLMHELGHWLGLQHSDQHTELMYESLPPGVRRMPNLESNRYEFETAEIDAMFSRLYENPELLPI